MLTLADVTSMKASLSRCRSTRDDRATTASEETKRLQANSRQIKRYVDNLVDRPVQTDNKIMIAAYEKSTTETGRE
jgi:hypothetical protein